MPKFYPENIFILTVSEKSFCHPLDFFSFAKIRYLASHRKNALITRKSNYFSAKQAEPMQLSICMMARRSHRKITLIHIKVVGNLHNKKQN